MWIERGIILLFSFCSLILKSLTMLFYRAPLKGQFEVFFYLYLIFRLTLYDILKPYWHTLKAQKITAAKLYSIKSDSIYVWKIKYAEIIFFLCVKRALISALFLFNEKNFQHFLHAASLKCKGTKDDPPPQKNPWLMFNAEWYQHLFQPCAHIASQHQQDF